MSARKALASLWIVGLLVSLAVASFPASALEARPPGFDKPRGSWDAGSLLGESSALSEAPTSPLGEAPSAPLGTTSPLGEAFTYQGELQDGGSPVNGTCDLRFRLWDAAQGGAQVGNTLTLTGVAVASGLFTTQRASRIATIPVGFGEGYPRSLFNKGVVLIQGQRCPVVGRVSLNVTTIDVTDLAEPPAWGDEVVLIGDQGAESITFEEMADAFDSVHTEINLSLGLMNPVRYIDD